MDPLSTHNIYFNLFPSHWLQKPHETFKKLKNAQNSLWEADYFQKMITVNVVTCQDGAVQFSDKIQDFPTDLK